MRIDPLGKLVDEPEIRAGFIGCGSHAFRNILPAFQFAPVRLVATCDVDVDKASAFAAKFGAERAYGDHRTMLEREELDAVFIVTPYDERGRPRYPTLALDCLEAARHVWMEKPPAATCAEIERLQHAAERNDRTVMVGFKKMFAPANRKAKRLALAAEFGRISLVRLEYPQRIPTTDELRRYLRENDSDKEAVRFLDHLCHPASLLVYLMGMPDSLFYERAANGAGVATFRCRSGAVAALAFTWGGGWLDGLERTVITSDSGQHIVVENNMRVTYHRLPWPGYGDVPDFYGAALDEATSVWQPEFSLGQLYNKGLFLLGYYDEVNEFARSILDRRPVEHGTLEQAWQITRIFEAFAEAPGATIDLGRRS